MMSWSASLFSLSWSVHNEKERKRDGQTNSLIISKATKTEREGQSSSIYFDRTRATQTAGNGKLVTPSAPKSPFSVGSSVCVCECNCASVLAFFLICDSRSFRSRHPHQNKQYKNNPNQPSHQPSFLIWTRIALGTLWPIFAFPISQ